MPPTGLGLGMLIMPVSILLMMRKDRGPAATFIEAGAVTPETVRRPAKLGIQRFFMIQHLEQRGVLVPTGDGRYYVDLVRWRRRRRRNLAIGLTVVGTMMGGAAWFLLSWAP